jgi:hypothetical protein
MSQAVLKRSIHAVTPLQIICSGHHWRVWKLEKTLRKKSCALRQACLLGEYEFFTALLQRQVDRAQTAFDEEKAVLKQLVKDLYQEDLETGGNAAQDYLCFGFLEQEDLEKSGEAEVASVVLSPEGSGTGLPQVRPVSAEQDDYDF